MACQQISRVTRVQVLERPKDHRMMTDDQLAAQRRRLFNRLCGDVERHQRLGDGAVFVAYQCTGANASKKRRMSSIAVTKCLQSVCQHAVARVSKRHLAQSVKMTAQKAQMYFVFSRAQLSGIA